MDQGPVIVLSRVGDLTTDMRQGLEDLLIAVKAQYSPGVRKTDAEKKRFFAVIFYDNWTTNSLCQPPLKKSANVTFEDTAVKINTLIRDLPTAGKAKRARRHGGGCLPRHQRRSQHRPAQSPIVRLAPASIAALSSPRSAILSTSNGWTRTTGSSRTQAITSHGVRI